MQNVQIELNGLQELSAGEMQETNGGTPFHLVVWGGIIIGAAIELIQDWDNFKAGLSGNCAKAKS